jgi:hypothetical protein
LALLQGQLTGGAAVDWPGTSIGGFPVMTVLAVQAVIEELIPEQRNRVLRALHAAPFSRAVSTFSRRFAITGMVRAC